MQVEAFQVPERMTGKTPLRTMITDQLRAVLEERTTRWAVVGVLLICASLSTLIPTPVGVDLAWMFIVPVAISAIAGDSKRVLLWR